MSQLSPLCFIICRWELALWLLCNSNIFWFWNLLSLGIGATSCAWARLLSQVLHHLDGPYGCSCNCHCWWCDCRRMLTWGWCVSASRPMTSSMPVGRTLLPEIITMQLVGCTTTDVLMCVDVISPKPMGLITWMSCQHRRSALEEWMVQPFAFAGHICYDESICCPCTFIYFCLLLPPLGVGWGYSLKDICCHNGVHE